MENSIYSVGAEGQQPVMGAGGIKGCRNHKTREWDDYIEIKRSWRRESREFPLLCVLASFATSDAETFEGSRTGSSSCRALEEAAKQQQTNTRGNFSLFWINNLCHVFWHVVSTPHFDTLLLAAAAAMTDPKEIDMEKAKAAAMMKCRVTMDWMQIKWPKDELSRELLSMIEEVCAPHHHWLFDHIETEII